MEHLGRLTLAGMDYGQDRWTTDTEFFSQGYSPNGHDWAATGEMLEPPALQLNSTFQIVSLCGGSSTGSWFLMSPQRALSCSRRTCANTPVCRPRFPAACGYEFISATTAARSTPAVGSMRSMCSAITTTRGHCLASCAHRARAGVQLTMKCCSAARLGPLRSRPLKRKFSQSLPRAALRSAWYCSNGLDFPRNRWPCTCPA